METGHEILHQFNINLHHHDVLETGHHHTIADHHVAGNHENQMAEEEREGFNYVALMLGLSCPVSAKVSIRAEEQQKHATMFVCMYRSITQVPATPPPLAASSL